jgi:SAM-dependent methyltransferase
VNVLRSLLGRRPARDRPDLAAWIANARRVLVVDGTGPGAPPLGRAFASARVLRHETSGTPGLPFHDRDPRRLPFADASFDAVVLADVLDKVLDAGTALDEALRMLAPAGALLLAQVVAPEEFEARAAWNALARMRDARHAWTPSARQLAAQVSGLRLAAERDASWDEDVDVSATLRPEASAELALLCAAAEQRHDGVVRDGELVAQRRAWLLTRRA